MGFIICLFLDYILCSKDNELLSVMLMNIARVMPKTFLNFLCSQRRKVISILHLKMEKNERDVYSHLWFYPHQTEFEKNNNNDTKCTQFSLFWISLLNLSDHTKGCKHIDYYIVEKILSLKKKDG